MGPAFMGLGPKVRLPQFYFKIEARPLFKGLRAEPVSLDKNKIKFNIKIYLEYFKILHTPNQSLT